MSLASILGGINDELIALGALDEGAALLLGVSPRAPRGAPSQVYWVPVSARWGPPNNSITRDEAAAFFEANPGRQIPRCLGMRHMTIECHIWAGGPAAGDDFSAAETLLNQVLSCLRHVAYGSSQYIGERWIRPGTDAVNLGHRVVAEIEIRIPIFEVQPGAATEQVSVQHVTQIAEIGPIPPGGSVLDVVTSYP